MRRGLATPAACLLLAGCTVQIGRNPGNQFTLDTRLSSEPSPAGEETPPERPDDTAPPAVPADGATEADGTSSAPPRVRSTLELERNWRLGAENDSAALPEDPAARYETLYRLFRADHREMERLMEQGTRARAVLFGNRAARLLSQMQGLLAPEAAEPLGAMRGRYEKLVADAPSIEGTLFRTRARALANAIAGGYAPGAAPLTAAAPRDE